MSFCFYKRTFLNININGQPYRTAELNNIIGTLGVYEVRRIFHLEKKTLLEAKLALSSQDELTIVFCTENILSSIVFYEHVLYQNQTIKA